MSNFLIQLEIDSSPFNDPSLIGKKLFASRNRFYCSNLSVMKPRQTFEHFLAPGAKLHCDIALPQMNDQDSWVATLAWLGGLNGKPDINSVHWHHELNRKTFLEYEKGITIFLIYLPFTSCEGTSQRGKIMSLESDVENGAVGGLIYNLDSGERAVFHRDDVYLFGTWYVFIFVQRIIIVIKKSIVLKALPKWT